MGPGLGSKGGEVQKLALHRGSEMEKAGKAGARAQPGSEVGQGYPRETG